MIELPGVVKRADLVGIERDRVTLLIAVVGGVRSDMGQRRAN